jgi:hypothetical protein
MEGSVIVRCPSACVAALMVAAAAAPALAQAPPASSGTDGPRWQLEVYGGGLVSSRSGLGRAGDYPDPETFTTVSGHPSAYVPSWYFGYGSRLLSVVNTALLVDPGMLDLDVALQRPVIRQPHGWHVGARAAYVLNRRWSLEMAAGYAGGETVLDDEARADIEAVRARFVDAWHAFARGAGYDDPAITSTLGFDERSAHRLLATGALRLQFRTRGRLRPYVAVGGGLASRFGDLPRATLTGRYRFVVPGGAPIDETDTVVMRFDLARHTPVILVGAGATWQRSARWGLQADIRAHITDNSVRNLVDAHPAHEPATGSATTGAAATDTYLSVQHSNAPGPRSSLGPPVTGVELFRARGSLAQVGLTAGVFWRF